MTEVYTSVEPIKKINPNNGKFQKELEEVYPLKSYGTRVDAMNYLGIRGFREIERGVYKNKDNIARIYLLRDARRVRVTREVHSDQIIKVEATDYVQRGFLISHEQKGFISTGSTPVTDNFKPSALRYKS